LAIVIPLDIVFYNRFLLFVLVFVLLCHVTLNLDGSLRTVHPQKSFPDFNEI